MFSNFFYRTYLPAHKLAGTRYLHFVGTVLALTALIIFLSTWDWWFLAVVPVFGYGFSWPAHWFVEGNRPETLVPPILIHMPLSLAGDFTMLAAWSFGLLGDEIAKSQRRFPRAWK